MTDSIGSTDNKEKDIFVKVIKIKIFIINIKMHWKILKGKKYEMKFIFKKNMLPSQLFR